MLAIEIELLTGRYAATAYNDRSRAEWPPHPARFFSALVAALHDHEPVDADERAALLWLEQQPAPSLDVSLEAAHRRVLDTFVPVNDISVFSSTEAKLRSIETEFEKLAAEPPSKALAKLIAKLEAQREKATDELVETSGTLSKGAIEDAGHLLPERRVRQARTFPVVIPERPWFAFAWQGAPTLEVRAALARLCTRVTRLGHSSSLVRCALTERGLAPSLIPIEGGDRVLRWVSPRQLDRLEFEFERHRATEQRVLPFLPATYGTPRITGFHAPTPSVFSAEWIVFERVGGARLQSSKANALCRALRAALVEQSDGEILPPELSGHTRDGGPAQQDHLAFLALPFIGYEFADGSIQGCALALPRDLSAEIRLRLLRLVARWEKQRGNAGRLELASPDLPRVEIQRVELSEKHTLRDSTWCRPARRFATATPIALDRNPGDLRKNGTGAADRAARAAQYSIADACERIGLPRPTSVEVSTAPRLTGAQPAPAFAPFPAKGGRFRRVLVHAEIEFAEPVAGPVLLGAGRYMGLGLCRPISGGAQ